MTMLAPWKVAIKFTQSRSMSATAMSIAAMAPCRELHLVRNHFAASSSLSDLIASDFFLAGLWGAPLWQADVYTIQVIGVDCFTTSWICSKDGPSTFHALQKSTFTAGSGLRASGHPEESASQTSGSSSQRNPRLPGLDSKERRSYGLQQLEQTQPSCMVRSLEDPRNLATWEVQRTPCCCEICFCLHLTCWDYCCYCYCYPQKTRFAHAGFKL